MSKRVIFLISAIFACCESASIVDDVKKCHLNDDVCLKALYRNILDDISDSGLPDLGIPTVDPFEVKDMEVTAMGMAKIMMPKGIVKGFKTCRSNQLHMDMDRLVAIMEIVCDKFSIEGDYKIEGTPTLAALIGGIKIHGEGKGSIVIDKIQLNMEISFEYKKLEDCELHAILRPDESSYTFKVLEKVTFGADNLYIGSQEISTVATNILNENWDFFTRVMGKTVVDKAVEVFMLHANKFFASVPVKDIILDDVSQYVQE